MATDRGEKSAKVESKLEEILDGVRSEPTHLNYWNAYKRIRKLDLGKLAVPEKERIRIALLGSFTLDPLAIYLDIDCRLAGLFPEVYVGPFNQYSQEILDDKSNLYKFDPHVIILAIHAESLVDDGFMPSFPALSMAEKERQRKGLLDTFRGVISNLVSRTKALILVNNLIVPHSSPFGILDNKVESGLRNFFRELNQGLAEEYAGDRQVYVVDLESLSGSHGKERAMDPEMYYRGSIMFSESFLPVLSRGYMAYIKALKNLSRKCIVLDLDNTLWGGVVGEDGYEGIKLGADPMGKAFVDFQRMLMAYYNRGLILAINSRNNYDDAIRVIREHPAMVLREKHFGAMQINWRDKVENMMELSRELGIGLDSMVFIDDNPHERERMRHALPQVAVVDLPPSPFRYVQTIQGLNDLDVLVLSEEDRRRGEMYHARRQRRQLLESKATLEDYLKSLETHVEIKEADDFTIPRITSLINRTNQFNLTTRRYTQAQVEEMTAHKDLFRIYGLRVVDRFGDEGIVGVAIIRREEDSWTIDSFLMSCRVIGRWIETAFLARICKDARGDGASTIIGELVPTAKNEPARTFYEDHGFEMASSDGELTRWRLDLDRATIAMPEWVVEEDG